MSTGDEQAAWELSRVKEAARGRGWRDADQPLEGWIVTQDRRLGDAEAQRAVFLREADAERALRRRAEDDRDMWRNLAVAAGRSIQAMMADKRAADVATHDALTAEVAKKLEAVTADRDQAARLLEEMPCGHIRDEELENGGCAVCVMHDQIREDDATVTALREQVATLTREREEAERIRAAAEKDRFEEIRRRREIEALRCQAVRELGEEVAKRRAAERERDEALVEVQRLRSGPVEQVVTDKHVSDVYSALGREQPVVFPPWRHAVEAVRSLCDAHDTQVKIGDSRYDALASILKLARAEVEE